MKYLIYAAIILATATASSGQALNGSFTTLVDHFRPQNYDRTRFVSVKNCYVRTNWMFHVVFCIVQYFEANYRYFQYGGPVYIYIKDARNNSFQWVLEGLMVDIAEETNATLYTFSPRFFGVNRPTP